MEILYTYVIHVLLLQLTEKNGEEGYIEEQEEQCEADEELSTNEGAPSS